MDVRVIDDIRNTVAITVAGTISAIPMAILAIGSLSGKPIMYLLSIPTVIAPTLYCVFDVIRNTIAERRLGADIPAGEAKKPEAGKKLAWIDPPAIVGLSLPDADSMKNKAAPSWIETPIGIEKPAEIAKPEAKEQPADAVAKEEPSNTMAKGHPANIYKSWLDVPGIIGNNGNGKHLQIRKDAPDMPQVLFRIWDEKIEGRRYTNSFAKDQPDVTYSRRMEVLNGKAGAPAKALQH